MAAGIGAAERNTGSDMTEFMAERPSRDWAAVGLRGIFAILLGVAALVWPGIYLRVLVMLFAGFLFFSGLASIAMAFRRRPARYAWFDIVKGFLEIALALIIVLLPGASMVVPVYIIAVWALFSGAAEIVLAVRWKIAPKFDLLMVAVALISIGFGIFLFLQPRAGVVLVSWLIGIYALVVGASYIFQAYRLRKWRTGADARPVDVPEGDEET
jgi:uncharacterized membrane protein HdeD (DUF308 family)